MVILREETSADYDAIGEINRQAFGGEDEVRLIDWLRADGDVIASVVAVEDGQVVGHILFCGLIIETSAGQIAAAALAPMAVRPERQRQGIGSKLVEHGLALCRKRGLPAVVVVGHPEYYPRFGFSASLAKNLKSPYSGPACMAMELAPGSIADVQGSLRYPRAFELLDH